MWVHFNSFIYSGVEPTKIRLSSTRRVLPPSSAPPLLSLPPLLLVSLLKSLLLWSFKEASIESPTRNIFIKTPLLNLQRPLLGSGPCYLKGLLFLSLSGPLAIPEVNMLCRRDTSFQQRN